MTGSIEIDNDNDNGSGSGSPPSRKRALDDNEPAVVDADGNADENANSSADGAEDANTNENVSETVEKGSETITSSDEPKPKKLRTEKSKNSDGSTGFKSFGASTSSSGFGSNTKAMVAVYLDPQRPPGASTSSSGFGSNTKSNGGSVFGSAAPSLGFGSAATTKISTPSSFGFGSTSTSNSTTKSSANSPLAEASNKSVFGSTTTSADKTEVESESKGTETAVNNVNAIAEDGDGTSAVALPEAKENTLNGEENEEVILTVRAKLYKFTKEKASTKKLQEADEKDDAENENGSANANTENKNGNIKQVGMAMATKIGVDVGSSDNKSGTDNSAKSTTGTGASSKDNSAATWKEVGIGPLRILKAATSTSSTTTEKDDNVRIVQRRENTPGGQGTKLILNIRLGPDSGSVVQKKDDKYVRLLCFEIDDGTDDDADDADDTAAADTAAADTAADKDTEEEGGGGEPNKLKLVPVQYLFKVKTVGEADSLYKAMKQFCKVAGGA
eukprot:CAMPEP_0194095296 /NCGR_PEP_ID=MMETSP0149-20130528/56756_1 /TAXON_ID=122233 /ORGANISM="Chaetoceros debilis, Strain MM31A-1" /LENGTH=501 /DNA_ID=CAMNT_0038781237 /DNA_START=61 /DNA_END=1567 /DNA_ORIENTATION=+